MGQKRQSAAQQFGAPVPRKLGRLAVSDAAPVSALFVRDAGRGVVATTVVVDLVVAIARHRVATRRGPASSVLCNYRAAEGNVGPRRDQPVGEDADLVVADCRIV